MPSPLAHASLVLLAAAWFDGRGSWRRGSDETPGSSEGSVTPSIGLFKAPSRRRAVMVFTGLVLMPLLLADADLILAMVLGRPLGQLHGTFMHSLLFGAGFSVFFAGLATSRWVSRHYAHPGVTGGFLFWLALSVSAWTAHLLMDAMTNGRGVMMFWPFGGERIRLPFTVFVGAEYSNLSDWHAHLATLVNEGLFALAVAGVSWGLWRYQRRTQKERANQPLEHAS